MPKAATQEQRDFLHVLEGGKGKAATPGKAAGRPKADRSAKATRGTKPRKAAAQRPRRPGPGRRLVQGSVRLCRRLGTRYRNARKSLGRRLRSKALRRRLAVSRNYLIVLAMVGLGAALLLASHWLIRQKSADSIDRVLELRGHIVGGRLDNTPEHLWVNPWSRRLIRVEAAGASHAIVLEDSNRHGCRAIVAGTLGRFRRLEVNGAAIRHRLDAQSHCEASDNRLRFFVP